MPIVLTAEQRDALYRQTIAELTLLDDLRQAWETGDRSNYGFRRQS